MLDLSDQPVLDKHSLLGGCIRLPLQVNARHLQIEVAQLPDTIWGTTGPRVGVHGAADVLFLRGYAPAEGAKPFDDRPALAQLPYARSLIDTLIPAAPLRCLLARLPAGATVLPHVDRGPYFAKSLRLHIPVVTHEQVWMQCAGHSYQMRPGEVWALNNSAIHGVWNDHPSIARIHLICDFLPSAALLDLLSAGEPDLGRELAAVKTHFVTASATSLAAE